MTLGNPAFLPEQVGPNDEGTALRIVWKDGHRSEFAPWTLRVACPCAGCVDEMSGRRILDPDRVSPGVHPLEIHYVGRYALQFMWSDGHQTGIYPFEFLRRLCDCPQCSSG